MNKSIRITEIEVYKFNIRYTEPFIISLGPIYEDTNILVRINTNEGVTGVDECSPSDLIGGETQDSAFETGKGIAGLVKGENPLNLNSILNKVNNAFVGNHCIKSAFDMALYDLIARIHSVPLYRIFGGENNRDIVTDMTIGLGPAIEMAKKATKYREQGFLHLKVKLGTSYAEDVERIKLIREAAGPELSIRIDANQGWDKVNAIKILKAIEKYDIEFCEEPIPCWNNTDLLKVTEASPIPVMADESLFDHRDAFRLASMGACDLFNIKLAKSGGLNDALKILAIAESSGISSQVGCMGESRLAITALVHLAMAYDSIKFFDLDPPLMHASDPVVGGIIIDETGAVTLPDEIGIGADLHPDFLKRLEKVVI